MLGAHGLQGKCCTDKGKDGKRRFQGKAFIPNDHIQLIAKNYTGANLNLEFEISDGERSQNSKWSGKSRSRSSRKSKRRRRSKSGRRRSRWRRKSKKRCDCCRCGKRSRSHKSDKNKRCCERTERNSKKKKCDCCCDSKPPDRKICCCGPSPRMCCSNTQNLTNPCCPKPVDPCCSKPVDPCCQQQVDCCCPKPVDPCCPKPVDPCCPQQNPCCSNPVDPCCVQHLCCGKTDCQRLKRCPCCYVKVADGQPHVCCKASKSIRSPSSKKKESRKCKSSEKSENVEKTASSTYKSSSKPSSKEKSREKEKKVEKRDVKKGDSKTKSNKTQKAGKYDSQTGADRKVYVSRRVSDLENNEVYGKYWYHRPPLENMVTPCDEDYYEYMPPVYDTHPVERKQAPPEPPRDLKEPKKKNAGYCVGCKEAMCLICKNFICNCECNRPNFVICNVCRHKLTPKKKKICPPPRPKRCVDTANRPEGAGNDELFLLPLLASMQNANYQSCNC